MVVPAIACLDRDDKRDLCAPAHAQPTRGLLIHHDAGRDAGLALYGTRDRDVKTGVTQALDRSLPAFPDNPRRPEEPRR
jgi:hypothetical protein